MAELGREEPADEVDDVEGREGLAGIAGFFAGNGGLFLASAPGGGESEDAEDDTEDRDEREDLVEAELAEEEADEAPPEDACVVELDAVEDEEVVDSLESYLRMGFGGEGSSSQLTQSFLTAGVTATLAAVATEAMEGPLALRVFGP